MQQEAEKKKEKALAIGKDLEVKQVEIEASKGDACTALVTVLAECLAGATSLMFADKDLERVEPLIQEAMQAVQSIKKASLDEMKVPCMFRVRAALVALTN